jgi:hypothetical protein
VGSDILLVAPELTERQTMTKNDKDDLAEHEKEQEHKAPGPGTTPDEPEQLPSED